MSDSTFKFGWAQVDITPEDPVILAGQFHARISEGIADPLTATALAIEVGDDHTIMISCDIIAIPDSVRDAVREKLKSVAGIDPKKVFLNATHTHTGPMVSTGRYNQSAIKWGIELPALSPEEYTEFLVSRVADAAFKAWQKRAPGSFAFGLGQTIIGRNRRWTDFNGVSRMYGNINNQDFNHIEGYEDQNINIAAFFSPSGAITGFIINIACPAQVDENSFVVSADYWHNVREELRRRYGKDVYILTQCSAAGDQAPQRMAPASGYTYDSRAEARMLMLKDQNERQQIGERVIATVADVLDCIKPTRDSSPNFSHLVIDLPLPLNRLTAAHAEEARREVEHFKAAYEKELAAIEGNPGAKDNPRWYVNVTKTYRLWQRHQRTIERFENQTDGSTFPIEIHIIRIGDMVIASNPFEYYLDYGIQIKARSPATQTFLVQLAGAGSYVPSQRSVEGGGYGSVPASNDFGVEAGEILREETLGAIDSLFPK